MGKKKGGGVPQHPGYEQFKDTPWISQGRDIASEGGQGILSNFDNVNVFSPQTNRSLEARNNDTYRRAFNEMDRNYTNTMNKYAGANYNRFGTLNSTPSAFVTDNYQRQFQRQMDDMSFNKAMNYDRLRDAELRRRYDTLNMFGNMYQYGQIPHTIDIANWNTRNTNRNIAHNNALANFANRKDKGSGLGGGIGSVIGGVAGGFFGGPAGAGIGMKLGNQLGGAVGGML